MKPVPLLADTPDETIFLFSDQRLVDATPAALLFVGEFLDREQIWTQLIEKLEVDLPDINAKLQSLTKSSQPFEADLNAKADTLTLSARMDSGLLRISLQQNVSRTETITIDAMAQQGLNDELALLRDVNNKAPILAWRRLPDGTIDWANNAYLDLLSTMYPDAPTQSWPLPEMFPREPALVGDNNVSGKRVSIKVPGNNDPLWFEILACENSALGQLNFALYASPVVRAEEALRNFVQTLTKTFAHLPIGLAIFDRQRKLALFNPALADLTTIKPDWLSQRPSLFSFLDQLRENRQMPEPKNYPEWRRKIIALEKRAQDGTYCENWLLPSGQTYRVTGRPHPEGALAFLIEDISAEISLQRQFRAELELGQSVIDNLTDAIVVFAPGGDLTMSNDAFAALWGIDPSAMLGRTDVVEMTKHWQVLCAPTPIWGDLRDFVNHLQERSEWFGDVRLKSGVQLSTRVNPLSGGATLVSFNPVTTPQVDFFPPRPEQRRVGETA